MREVDNILRILEETKQSINSGNVSNIKNLSNETTNTASLTQDPDNIAIAVILYAISKILEREGYRKLPGWNNFYNSVLRCIDHEIEAIKNNDEKKISHELKRLMKFVEGMSGNLKVYIQDVLRKASINKASKIYEHGISLEKTANLLGVTMFELASYAGQREEIHESNQISKPVNLKSRVKLAMEFFS